MPPPNISKTSYQKGYEDSAYQKETIREMRKERKRQKKAAKQQQKIEKKKKKNRKKNKSIQQDTIQDNYNGSPPPRGDRERYFMNYYYK